MRVTHSLTCVLQAAQATMDQKLADCMARLASAETHRAMCQDLATTSQARLATCEERLAESQRHTSNLEEQLATACDQLSRTQVAFQDGLTVVSNRCGAGAVHSGLLHPPGAKQRCSTCWKSVVW